MTITNENEPAKIPAKRLRPVLVIVFLAAALIGLFFMAPDGDAFHFTVILETNLSHHPPTPDPVRLKLAEDKWLLAPCDWKGRAVFEGIPGQYRNKPVSVVIDQGKWRFSNGTTQILFTLKGNQARIPIHLEQGER